MYLKIVPDSICWREGKIEFNAGGLRVSMDTERATRLFHDINRVLSLVDQLVGNTPVSLDANDQASYERLNTLAGLLQAELNPGQEEG